MKRMQIIDAARGLAILLMVLYNYSVTLNFFKLINLPDSLLYWSALPWLIAGTFIVLSGTAAYTSYKNRKEGFARRYFKRGGRLLIFAALITLFTYIFAPQGTVIFGILHFFAFSSFIIPFVIRHDKFNLIAGLLISIAGFYLQFSQFNFSYLLWLGLIPRNFFTFDYFPMMPWLGILMLGIYLGGCYTRKISAIKFSGKLSDIFSFLGRHSLTIYLIHQPMLVLLLMALGFGLRF